MWLQNSFSAQNRIIRSNSKNTVKYVINTMRRIIRLRRMTHPWCIRTVHAHRRYTHTNISRIQTFHAHRHYTHTDIERIQMLRAYKQYQRMTLFVSAHQAVLHTPHPFTHTTPHTHTHTHTHTRTHTHLHTHSLSHTHSHTHTHTTNPT